MTKLVITSGCSFSVANKWGDTWPRHLSRAYPEFEYRHTGLSSQGNGLISRRVIYEVTEALKTHRPEDILVGIMWSGIDRYDFYTRDAKGLDTNIDNWEENPTKFINPPTGGNWVILNWNWQNEYAKQYYTTFYDRIGSLIYSLEHILRTQWFLKAKNIPYFMTTYTKEVFPDVTRQHIDTQYLYDQIDFDQFLGVVGEFEWVKERSGIGFKNSSDGLHPSPEQHRAFTEQIVIPFLHSKNYL
jgi:hypothetical protein